MRITDSVIKRFWSYVNKTEDINHCWLWIGTLNQQGYGQLRIKNRIVGTRGFLAHRISYQLHNGDLQDSLVVRHSCHNPACVNPKHLSLGTQWDNVQDSIKDGLIPSGQKHYKFVSDSAFVESVKKLRAEGLNQTDIAIKLNVSQSHISRVLCGLLGEARRTPRQITPETFVFDLN